jgi:hypothetical protein
MKEGLDDWHVRHITLEEAIAAGRVGIDWVEKRKRQWGENSAVYKNRVLAEFATDGSEGIIPLEWIEAAMDRWRAWDEQGRPGEGLGIRKIGVDAARYGVDKTVFAEGINDRLEKLHIYANQPVPVSAGYLKPLAHKSAAINIEMDSGLGAGIFDILRQEEDPFNPSMNLVDIYMAANTTRMDQTNTFRFNSTRSAAWWNMRELLDPMNEKNIALYPSDTLLGDLAAPRYEIVYRYGWLTICVEDKEHIRKKDRLGRSTDEGDATVLLFWDAQPSGGGVVF